jgi:hypothetical protein
MAEYRTMIHHTNYTAVGRGYTVTKANANAVAAFITGCESAREDDYELVCELATAVRSARRGGVGEVKWRIDRDKSFIIVERV